MQVLLMAEQTKTIDETNKSEIMIAVQVRNKNMRNLTPADFVIDHLNLRAFATINQIIVTVNSNYLTGRMPVKCRNSRVIAQNGNCKHETAGNLVSDNAKTKTNSKLLH